MNTLFYHLKIAIRNLRRGTLYSVINIGGLAVSLAAVILIMLWVWDELSYDRFHKNAENIYRVNTYLGESCWDLSQLPLGEKMVQDMPQVERYCRMSFPDIVYLEHNGEKFFCEDKMLGADTVFFSIFDFRILRGDVRHLSTSSMVVDRTVARKLFGNGDAVGQTVKADNGRSYEIAAVMDNMPSNSTLQYSVLIFPDYSYQKSWFAIDCYTYVQLRPGADAVKTGTETTELLKAADSDFALATGFKVDLQNIRQHHLYAPDGTERGVQTVRLFCTIAILILVIACINYVNMVTARASKRSKEVGVKRIIGATKTNLLGQFLNEAALLFVVAVLLSLLLVYGATPAYNHLTAKTFGLASQLPRVLVLCAGIFITVMILAGLYPAVTLSKFRSGETIGKHNAGYQFSYDFVDETFDEMHRADLRTGVLFNIFALIAILISCLGLFGLVTYTAETKTREIGIRKVLGADVAGIVEMLSKEFLILVGIAMLIAFPLAYYWLNRMLQDYAYRIDISWWMFALAGMITIMLTLITVGWKAVSAATANPVKAIKSE